MSFIDILGQDAATQILKKAVISNKVHHAYLFCGPNGVGKKKTAVELARVLNCENPMDKAARACGKCISCKKIMRQVHPDLLMTGVPETKKVIPVETIRQLEKIFLSGPFEGRAKVAIIDCADQMSREASNALLKTLEEPRLGNYLVLLTSRPASLLPTVISRCQAVKFKPLTEDIIISILKKMDIKKQDLSFVSVLCQGSLEKALEYLEDDILPRLDDVLNMLKAAKDRTPKTGMEIASGFIRDRQAAGNYLELLMVILGYLVREKAGFPCAISNHLEKYGNADIYEEVFKQFTILEFASLVNLVHKTYGQIRDLNAAPQTAIEGMFLKMRRGETIVNYKMAI